MSTANVHMKYPCGMEISINFELLEEGAKLKFDNDYPSCPVHGARCSSGVDFPPLDFNYSTPPRATNIFYTSCPTCGGTCTGHSEYQP